MKTNAEIEKLIKQLQGKNGMERQRVRHELVKIGKPAVPFLIELLSSPREQSRWEACKALGTIGEVSACKSFVTALRDENLGVRWLAAEGLVALGNRSLIPLMEALTMHFDSIFLREGAHHVLHDLEIMELLDAKSKLVLDALRYMRPESPVAWAAREALIHLRQKTKR